jgi:hypothetical protein
VSPWGGGWSRRPLVCPPNARTAVIVRILNRVCVCDWRACNNTQYRDRRHTQSHNPLHVHRLHLCRGGHRLGMTESGTESNWLYFSGGGTAVIARSDHLVSRWAPLRGRRASRATRGAPTRSASLSGSATAIRCGTTRSVEPPSPTATPSHQCASLRKACRTGRPMRGVPGAEWGTYLCSYCVLHCCLPTPHCGIVRTWILMSVLGCL